MRGVRYCLKTILLVWRQLDWRISTLHAMPTLRLLLLRITTSEKYYLVNRTQPSLLTTVAFSKGNANPIRDSGKRVPCLKSENHWRGKLRLPQRWSKGSKLTILCETNKIHTKYTKQVYKTQDSSKWKDNDAWKMGSKWNEACNYPNLLCWESLQAAGK